ncbi:hypothetical protein [Enterobacter sp. Bisph1]|uniref:hypothetical protein n=1 Tax=Enterobacter sp. Bisph1 TaxID=1274399 RepID=UPI00057C166A|nr:hypothetical protein [Enterobacter sp. Bisph1]
MPASKRMPVPKVKHFGFYFDIDRGFADITDEKNLPIPEKTLLSEGVNSGIAGQTEYNNLYCISTGFQDELIIAFYEQLSGYGELIYLHEDNTEYFTECSKFLSKIDISKPHRLFATFTGGNALLASRAARLVTLQLKDYTFQRVVWNTWSWLPPIFTVCVIKEYVVRLDLNTGDVKSFATNYNQVERFIRRKGFAVDICFAAREKLDKWLKDWFDKNKEYAAYKEKALLLNQKDPNVYSMKMFESLTGEPARLLASYEKDRYFCHENDIISHPTTEILIMLPSEIYDLPKGIEQVKQPAAEKEGFIFEKPITTQPQRRNVKKAPVKEMRIKPSAVSFHRTESLYTVQESEMFNAQRNLLDNYYGEEAQHTLSHIEVIKNDLATGRLPRKSVEHYFVADLPALSRSKGRGAWRLLITRNQKVLTLHIIADYHDGTWIQWS